MQSTKIAQKVPQQSEQSATRVEKIFKRQIERDLFQCEQRLPSRDC